MLAVDTNVLIRCVLNDEQAQARVARSLVADNEVWVSTTVLLECEWVLRSAAGLDRERVHFVLTSFLGLPTVRVETPERVACALDWFAQGMDFADALHLAGGVEEGCEAFASFDRRLAAVAKRAGAGRVKAL